MVDGPTAYLGVVGLASAEEGIQGVVAWNNEASEVHKELSADVEEDEEKVNSHEAQESVDFRHRCLLLKVVQGWIFGQL